MKMIFFLIAFFLVSCDSYKENTKEEIVRGVEDISITSQNYENTKDIKEKQNSIKNDEKNFYYSLKKQEINTDVSSKTFTKIDAQKAIRNTNPYLHVQIDLLKSSLSKNFILKCSSCHDDYANGIIGPSLLDKDGKFIYEQMVAYKYKKKVNVLMKDLVSKMSEVELKSLSDEIAKFNLEIRKLNKEK